MVIRTQELLTTGTTATRLSLSTRRVLQLADAGKLAAIRLSDGQRVFTIEAVEALARERQSIGAAV